MGAPIDEQYFRWLYEQVADSDIKNPKHTYWKILKLLYIKEFVWFVPNDDNRVADGRDLRQEFIEQQKITGVDESWMRLGCSVFEMMVALARRLAFETDFDPDIWFWEMMSNLGLWQWNDKSAMDAAYVDEVLERLIWRTYKHNGEGGLFPLEGPCEDQRRVELWYQLSAYLLERN